MDDGVVWSRKGRTKAVKATQMKQKNPPLLHNKRGKISLSLSFE
jgi:hypothetical protein